MKHFISFQKRKGLAIPMGTSGVDNTELALQINHELMRYGYLVTEKLLNRLSTQDSKFLQVVYNDLISGIRSITGDGGYEPIYRNFPQSVTAISYREFAINAIFHYWSYGNWRPEDVGYLKREFAIEAIKYKEISLIEESEFNSIFTDIIYSNNSISKFDKRIIDWFIDGGYAKSFNFSNIGFKETMAYVGKRLVESDLTCLPTKDATAVLRIWSAYSDGDEGLKVNTKFKNPKSKQRALLMTTLDGCYNLEESFKIYREKWLKLLFYLNPSVSKNRLKYPNLEEYTDKLRNTPNVLKTFNSKIEKFLNDKDVLVLALLKTRMGTFTRRLDHTIRLFGLKAFKTWIENNPTTVQMIDAYNHFTDRDKEQAGRSVVLASQSKSEVTTYESLAPLDSKLVATIKEMLLHKLYRLTNSTLSDNKVYIDPLLYYRPLGINNRASSLSLDGKGIGTVESLPKGKVVRLYVHWDGRSDIDLSGLAIYSGNLVEKIGWNGSHHVDEAIVYSGDNTGYAEKNAEYLDIVTHKLSKTLEWIICEARIYSGPNLFSEYHGRVRAGWMLRDNPEQNNHWLPETLEHCIVLNAESKTAFLMAYHVPTNSVVYLDVAMGNSNVSGTEDALKLKMYLDKFIVSIDKEGEICWDKLNQGHLINLLSKNIVKDKKDADIVFDENTTVEEVTKYLV